MACSWGNSHRVRILHRQPRETFSLNVLTSDLAKPKRQKALYPQGPTWVRPRTRENVPMRNADLARASGHQGVGPARGVVFSGGWSRRGLVLWKTGGRGSEGTARHPRKPARLPRRRKFGSEVSEQEQSRRAWG